MKTKEGNQKKNDVGWNLRIPNDDGGICEE